MRKRRLSAKELKSMDKHLEPLPAPIPSSEKVPTKTRNFRRKRGGSGGR